MDPQLQTWAWLVAGGALLVSEAFLPGFVAAFFGVGALATAAARWAGLIESTGASVGFFAVSSVASVLLLRRVLVRAFGEGERTRESTSEDVRAFGTVVEVVEDVVEGEPKGRIRYEGTTWSAVSAKGALPAGSKARLLHRDNIGWVVEAEDGTSPLPAALPARNKTS